MCFTIAGVKNIVRYTKDFVSFYCIISNHGMRMSMMWRIMEIEEAVIQRGEGRGGKEPLECA